MVNLCKLKTPLGFAVCTTENNSITGFWFIGQKHFPKTLDLSVAQTELPIFKRISMWLNDYFTGNKPYMEFNLILNGTDFQKSVWNQLLKIPYGSTTTYKEISNTLYTNSALAVGQAVARNPISLFVPCHRVIGSNGSLTGYAHGLANKQFLLTLEKQIHN